MIGKKSRFAAVAAMAAAASLAATPAAAQGWGGGWDGWGGHRHHDHIDAGDVIAGVLIIGGIAAIASAASKSKRDNRNDTYRGDYPGQRRGSNYGNDNDQQWQQNGSVDSAVNRCSNEVSRGSGRKVSVETINRDGDGWRVEGRTGEGGNFTCSVDGSGQIRNVQVDGRAY